MGSPLGPSLANAFFAHHEENWLDSCSLEHRPSCYPRYVDDKFVLSKSSDHFKRFHSYLNSCHANVTFTVETEQNKKISFLDVNIIPEQGKFITSSIYTLFHSFLPDTYKTDMIYTLVNMYFFRYAPVCQCSIKN